MKFDFSLGLKVVAGGLTIAAGVIDHQRQQKEISKTIAREVGKQMTEVPKKIKA